MCDIRLPNFIYIGPDKAGSTWIFDVLRWHPDCFPAPAKDTYFFDRNFGRGIEWYKHQFSGHGEELVVAELSHDYLYDPLAAERMHGVLGAETKLMVNLREPVDRAFSAYLYLVKHGLVTGSFFDAIDSHPELLEHGNYAKYLARYLELFGAANIHIACFDDLKVSPRKFASELFDFLEVRNVPLPDSLLSASLQAAAPRSAVVARAAKGIAIAARRIGLARTLGRIKRLGFIHKLLYRNFDAQSKPRPLDDENAKLREIVKPWVLELDKLLSTNFMAKWGYRENR